jgi:hypothetical protein
MSYAQAVWHELHSGRRSTATGPDHISGLLGIALLCMLCLADTQWLLKTGGPDAVNVVAAAESIHLVE